METIDNKTKQNKAQYNLDRHATDILALSSANVGEYKFLRDEDVLPEKNYWKRLPQYKDLNICF